MVHFVNITETEFLQKKFLYKHLSLEDSLKWLNNKSLWFSNPSKWKDPFERRFLEAKYTKSGKSVGFNWVDRVYCTCYSQTASSEAFWKSYTKDTICIEFRINRSNLLDILKSIEGYEVYVGRVQYMLTSDIIKTRLSEIPFNPPFDIHSSSSLTAARLFMLKRVSFSYENEIRVLLVSKEKSHRDGIAIKYSIQNTDLIGQIVLDPSIGPSTEAMLKQLFEHEYGFLPTNRGAKRIIKSALYSNQVPATISID